MNYSTKLALLFCCVLSLVSFSLLACGDEKGTEGGGVESLDAALEGRNLEKLVNRLALSMEGRGTGRAVKKIGQKGSFRELMAELAVLKHINDIEVMAMAGQAGKAVKGEYTAEAFTRESCIFAGPSSGEALHDGLRQRLEGKKIGPLGVTFTLRADYLDQALAGDGKFPIVIGAKMEMVTLESLEAMIAEDTSLPQNTLKGKKAAELFGTYPFEHVAKE